MMEEKFECGSAPIPFFDPCTSDRLDSMLLSLRERAGRKNKGKSHSEPVACWLGKDTLECKPIPALTIILSTVGCSFARSGGCTMCGYINDASIEPPGADALVAQLKSGFKKAPLSDFVVKIFTSGSFFDMQEVGSAAQKQLLECLEQSENVRKVIVETRPEFVNRESLGRVREVFHKPFEIAMGLESANDTIRKFCINKRFTFDQFREASSIASGKDITVRAYLLLKPPFLSEGDALRDVIESISRAAHYAGTISINPCNVQRGTLVEELYHGRGYRPPWLWSIIEALRSGKENNPDTTIISDPVAAGTERGPYNCPECNKRAARVIEEFSVTQQRELLERFHCDCKHLWEKVVALENYTYGAQLKIR